MRSVKGFNENFNGEIFEINLFVPRFEMISKAKVTGKILIIPIQGDGTSKLVMEKAELAIKLKVKAVQRNGKDYLMVDKVKIRLTPQK